MRCTVSLAERRIEPKLLPALTSQPTRGCITLRGRAVPWVTGAVASTDVVPRALGGEWALVAPCCCMPSSSQQTAATPAQQGPSHVQLVSAFPSEALGVCSVKRSVFRCLNARAGNCKHELCLADWLPDPMSFIGFIV